MLISTINLSVHSGAFMDYRSWFFCPYASDCPHLPSVKCTCYLLESIRYLTTNPRYLAPKYRSFLTSSICSPYTTLLSLSLACTILSVLHFSAFRVNLTLATSSVNLTVFLRKSLNFYHTYVMSSAKSSCSSSVVQFHRVRLPLPSVLSLMTDV